LFLPWYTLRFLGGISGSVFSSSQTVSCHSLVHVQVGLDLLALSVLSYLSIWMNLEHTNCQT
jgi:hypothetical protein